MKTNISRIGLMSLALLTSLTAVGQITDAKKNLEIPRSANLSTKADLGTGEKKSAADSKSLNLKSDPNKAASEKSLDARSSDKSQPPAGQQDALGGVNGGGGSFATVDGQIVLADTYYKKIGKPKTFEKAFSAELQSYVSSMLGILDHYGIPTGDFYRGTIADSSNLYVFVTPAEFSQIKCDHYLPPLNQPAAKHVQFACTKGRTTYLVPEGDFSDAPILEQARAIVHERLWTKMPNVDQRYIADFTTYLAWLKTRQDDQIFRNNRSPLTDDEIEMFDDLQIVSQQLGFGVSNFAPALSYMYRLERSNDGWKFPTFSFNTKDHPLSASIIRNGGGLNMGQTQIDETSFIGIGSMIGSFSQGKTSIQNSTILGCNVIGSTIMNSSAARCSIFEATIKNSNVTHGSWIDRSSIDDSNVKKTFVKLTDVEQSNLDDSDVSLQKMFSGPEYKSAKIRFADVSGSTIEDYSLLGAADQKVVVQNSELRGQTHCHGGILRCKSVDPTTIGAKTRIVKTTLKKGGSIGSNVEINNVKYLAEKDTDSIRIFVEMPEINIAANSMIQNLTYTFKPKDHIWEQGNHEIEVDTKGQTLDFNGKDCTSIKQDFKVHTADDLLQHCQ